MVEDLRPDIPEECPDHLAVLMRQCWHVDELVRPSFKDLLNTVRAAALPPVARIARSPDIFFMARSVGKRTTVR